MRFVMRAFLAAALVLGVGADDALAKKGKRGKGKDDQGILLTGIESFDTVFVRVGEIDTRLRRAERSLKRGQRQLNISLELKRGTPFTDAVAELKKRADNKLELTLTRQNVPKLKASDAVPTNVQTSVDAFNTLTQDITSSLSDLSGIGPEIDALVKETKGMPDALKAEFKKDANFLDLLFKLPKTTKALSRDIGITTGLPGRATAVTTEMTDLLDIVKREFAPAPGGPNRRGDESERPRGGKPAGGPGGKRKP